MVKLTQEVIEQASQSTNPVKDRQLDLRGYKIPAIENMGATLDQFDTIDFTDNEIKKLDNFPLLKRLKCLLLSNNHINRIGENLEAFLPSLESLVLINNRIQELGDLDPLASITSLQSLSLLTNPVSKKKHYRAYVIHKIPQLKRLDFERVKESHRLEAARLFGDKKGEELLKQIGEKSKLLPPVLEASAGQVAGKPAQVNKPHNAKDLESFKAAMEAANTLEAVEKLNHLLQSGQPIVSSRKDEEEDEDMEM